MGGSVGVEGGEGNWESVREGKGREGREKGEWAGKNNTHILHDHRLQRGPDVQRLKHALHDGWEVLRIRLRLGLVGGAPGYVLEPGEL